ncbi:MAG: MFS transporter [bacterium]
MDGQHTFAGRMRRLGVNKQVLALSGARMADAFCNSLLIVLLPLYVVRIPRRGIFSDLPDELLIGMLISLAGGMFALMQPVAATVSDRVGRRKPFIIGGLAILGAATLGYIPADSYRALIALRGLQGVGIAFTIPTALALISDYADQRTVGGSMGVFTTMRMIGFAIGPLAGGLIMELVSFETAFVTGAVGAALSIVMVVLFVPEVRVDEEAEMDAARRRMAAARAGEEGGRQHGLPEADCTGRGGETDRWGNDRCEVRWVMRQLYLMGGAVFVMAVGISLIAAVEPELNRRLGQTAVGFGVAFAMLTVARFLTQIPIGRLSDEIGRKPLIVGGTIAMIPLTVLQGYAPTTFLLSIDRFLLGAATAAIVAPGYAMVADRALPGLKVRQMSVMTMAFGLGVAAGPLFSGATAGIIDFHVPFLLGGAASAAAAVMIHLFIRESNPRTPAYTDSAEAAPG